MEHKCDMTEKFSKKDKENQTPVNPLAYAFVGSSPTSPTSLSSLREIRPGKPSEARIEKPARAATPRLLGNKGGPALW
jgi:hypothetical protein